MKKYIPLIFAIQLAGIFCFAQVAIENPHCENRNNPVGLDVHQPKLSWQFVSPIRNTLQTAYEIRVAERAEDITRGKNLVWHTGRVSTDQSVYIPYSGNTLQSGKKYFWQVRVWDNHGKFSSWSKPAFWQMGLLHATDCKARRISYDSNKFNPHATQPVRRFQWWGWLSTIGGYISGNGYIWPFIDLWWERHLNTPATLDMQRLNGFIKSVHWWELVPSGLNGMKTLITSGGSKDSSTDYVAAAATPDGTLLIAYIPPDHTGSITVDMTVLKDTIKAYWYDPANGISTAIAGSPFNNKSARKFTPPGKNSGGQNDWVLKFVASEF